MPTSPIVQLQMMFAVGGILFALWKGGSAERATAAVVAANMVLGILKGVFLPSQHDQLRFVLDGVTAVVLLLITVRYGAAWMGAVMLLFASQFALHAYYLIAGRDPADYLHALVNNFNNSAMVLCLVLGTVTVIMRRRTPIPAA